MVRELQETIKLTGFVESMWLEVNLHFEGLLANTFFLIESKKSKLNKT